MDYSILRLMIAVLLTCLTASPVQVKYSLRHRERFAVDDDPDPDVIDVPAGFIGAAPRVKRDYLVFPTIHEEHWEIQDDNPIDEEDAVEEEEDNELPHGHHRSKRATTFKKTVKPKEGEGDPRESSWKKWFLLILVMTTLVYVVCLLYCTYCCCCRDLRNGFGCPCRDCWAAPIMDSFDTYAPGMEFNVTTGKFSYHAITVEEEEAVGDIVEAGMAVVTKVVPGAAPPDFGVLGQLAER